MRKESRICARQHRRLRYILTPIISLPKDPENLNNPNFYYYEPVQGETQFGVTCAVGNACAYIFSARLEGSSPNPGCNACLGSHNYCISGGGAQPGASC